MRDGEEAEGNVRERERERERCKERKDRPYTVSPTSQLRIYIIAFSIEL
jgi:hypothetical protein